MDALYALVCKDVPYILTLEAAEAVDPCGAGAHLLVIGRADSHPIIHQAIQAGWMQAETRPEGYSIRLGQSPFDSKHMLCVIQGADAAGMLYGVRDFEHRYVQALRYEGYHYDRRFAPFVDAMPPFVWQSAPQVEHRGVWMWGHTLHALCPFLDAMSRYKLNTLILWNDHAPTNGREIVKEAHRRSIRVVWGYTWCWGEELDPLDPAQRSHWEERAVQTYKNEYEPLGGDGIYYQLFTETTHRTIGGRQISVLATEWTNQIAGRMLREFPGLWIQFGLHATSIGEEAVLEQVLSEVSIVWEDAGTFPYHYDPRIQRGFAKTLDRTRRMAGLRGAQERFGAIFKGMTVLNWTQFEHQQGPVLNGAATEEEIAIRNREAAFTWRFALPYWVTHADRLRTICRAIAQSGARDRLVALLVEHGMLERGMRLPVALCAELLWDAGQDLRPLLVRLFQSQDILLD